MPNTKNINRLIAKLRTLPEEKFDMTAYGTHIDVDAAKRAGKEEHYHPCNTAGCICGWANFIRLTEDESVAVDDVLLSELADYPLGAEWLGISLGLSAHLFVPRPNVTTAKAIAVLEHLRDTSKIKWPVEADPYPGYADRTE